MKLLIDADIVAYQAAVSAQTSGSWTDNEHHVFGMMEKGKAKQQVKSYIDRTMEATGAKGFIMCLSGDNNFRYDVASYYKGNRKSTCKPIGLGELKDYIAKTYESITVDNLEADDVMGIYGSRSSDYIVVSEDKDLQTIPCTLFNPAKDKEVRHITQAQADFFLYCQVLAGDTTDGYTGCPSFGMKTAEKWLTKHGTSWDSVVAGYRSKDLGEQLALENMRLARILRDGEYDFKTGEVKLWTP